MRISAVSFAVAAATAFHFVPAPARAADAMRGIELGMSMESVEEKLGQPDEADIQDPWLVWRYNLLDSKAQLALGSQDNVVSQIQVLAVGEPQGPLPGSGVRGVALGDAEAKALQLWGKPLYAVLRPQQGYRELSYRQGWTLETRGGKVTAIARRAQQPENEKNDVLKAADAAYEQQDYKTALSIYESAALHWPGEYQAHFGAGRCAYWLEDYTKAYRHLKRAELEVRRSVPRNGKQTPENTTVIGAKWNTPDLYSKLGIACAELRKYQEAVPHLEKAKVMVLSKNFPEDVQKKLGGDIAYHLALSQASLGKKKEALENALKARELQPGDPYVENLLRSLR